MKLRVGIIGLGNIGSLFDDDPKRKGISTHAGAYQNVRDVILSAGTDVDEARRNRFSSSRGVSNVYSNYREMLETERLDIVSICVPTEYHYAVTKEVLGSGVKAVFLEKPITSEVPQAKELIDVAEKKGIVLAVNHIRRWDQNYRRVKDVIDEGRVGEIKSLIGTYSGGVFLVGTHLIDTLRFFGGDIAWLTATGDNLHMADPLVSGLLSLKSGGNGFIISSGKREDLVFEIDCIGSRGRVRIIDNGRRTELYEFRESKNYSGYQELQVAPLPKLRRGRDRLVMAVEDILHCIRHGGKPACSGEDGLKALEIAAALCVSARNNGKKIDLG